MSHLFDYDDSLLGGLVGYNVEYVVSADDAIFHLSIATNIWIVGFNATDRTSDLRRLRSGHPEGI